MLPFVFLDESKLGPFHPFGLMIAFGFFAWDAVVMRRAVRYGLDRRDFRALTLWLCGMGTFMAWAVDAVFYHPEGAGPSSLLSFQGFSNTGGFIGAVLGAAIWKYVRVWREGLRPRFERRAEPMRLMLVSEVIVSTWPIAFFFGRLGCALVHDHPGVAARPGTLGALFAVAWPIDANDGHHHVLGPLHVVWGSTLRYDLGVLECLYLGLVALAFAATFRLRFRPWTYTAAGCLLYAPVRFSLDFLRLADTASGGDARHLGLTFAQWWAVAVFSLGLLFAWLSRRSEGLLPPAAPAPAAPAPATLADETGAQG
jgi:phosphatidylglycerol:prolipoprotein diacylglycerol transferase